GLEFGQRQFGHAGFRISMLRIEKRIAARVRQRAPRMARKAPCWTWLNQSRSFLRRGSGHRDGNFARTGGGCQRGPKLVLSASDVIGAAETLPNCFRHQCSENENARMSGRNST